MEIETPFRTFLYFELPKNRLGEAVAVLLKKTNPFLKNHCQ
jgi:hypothetical protein